ncbi:DUF1802 family protein [Deinococcus taeanensis]|uniref:DUF1802 family protein n=1 Tax=Deinococcus taeanensis TaxID=2737050 RepID=UPI001CDD6736|nr:DUF1802 family protein [Deinococcus taeanensis]UBV42816.1 DUF1802 family protein [Deinococcus taeanensis]
MSLSALKEWDVQSRLLTSGELSLLVRKGGIMETHEGFEVEHRSFLLYPTFLHQNPDELQANYRELLRDDPEPGVIQFSALAEVVAVHRVESLETALQLEPLQALTAPAIERRFKYRNRPWVHALLLRVRPLLEPLVLPETPGMLGCVSWVPLSDVLMKPGEPVVPEDELLKRQMQLESLMYS